MTVNLVKAVTDVKMEASNANSAMTILSNAGNDSIKEFGLSAVAIERASYFFRSQIRSAPLLFIF